MVYHYSKNRFSPRSWQIFKVLLAVVFLLVTFLVATQIAERSHQEWLLREYGNALQQQSGINQVCVELMKNPRANVYVPEYVIYVNRSEVAGKMYIFVASSDLYYYGLPEEYSIEKIQPVENI